MSPATSPHQDLAHAFSTRKVVRLDAAGVIDAQGVHAVPGSLLLEVQDPSATPPRSVRIAGSTVPRVSVRILGVGSSPQIDADPRSTAAHRVGLPNHVLIPPLVNGHTHLDLTDIGPRQFDPKLGFTGWIDMVRRERPTTPDAIAAAVRHGIELSLQGGVAGVGDIAGAPAGQPQLVPFDTLRESPLAGVSFIEFFAIGKSETAGIARAEALLRAAVDRLGAGRSLIHRLGLQPHAPNTVSVAAFQRAVDLAEEFGLPVTTHLAETLDERSFVARAEGPQRDLLERLGLWDDALRASIGLGLSPIAHLAGVLQRRAFSVAHVNDASDADLEILHRSRATVVYCPRASTYFGAADHFGPHRYRDMLAMGIPVALGTDSVINLPDADLKHTGLSTWDEIRLLHLRDATPCTTLLAMATIHGARALGLDPSRFTFATGASPMGILGLPVDNSPPHHALHADPLAGVLRTNGRPTFLFVGN